MTTTREYRSRGGRPINVGDEVDVMSFGADGIEGGTVVKLATTRGVNLATVRQASGSKITVRVINVVPR